MTDWTFSQWYVAAVIGLRFAMTANLSYSGQHKVSFVIAKVIVMAIYAGVVVALMSGGFF